MNAPSDDTTPEATSDRLVASNFITEIIDHDLRSGRHGSVQTRFPPEPNGYAHLGHAFASYLDFGIARDYGGVCHLRFDDTNPEVEELRYVRSIEDDLRWLGWNWPGTRFASDYFEQLYQLALRLIEMGDAYVDSQPADAIQESRGSVDEPGRLSPFRDRGVEENLDLFRRMRAGEFPNGAHVLRARIDMASPNMKLRDPLLYRIVHQAHYRTADAWPIYPFYDFQHPLSDAIEGVTHSLCSLEFLDNRDLYDWLVERLFPGERRPRQYEFGRRSIEYTVVSKRRLQALVRDGHVAGWDDPRMPTLAGLRRRGVRPEAVRDFAGRVSVSRTNRTVDIALLEHSIRDDLNTLAPRVMAVVDPLKVVLTNVDQGRSLEAPYWPPDVGHEGRRALPFGRELFIERDDFALDPPRGFRRLAPGRSVRLRHGFVVRCDEAVRNAEGDVVELRCTADLDTLGRNPEGVKVGAAIHWLAADTALPAEFRLYDRLFTRADPDAGGGSFIDHLNPDSLRVRHGWVEPSVAADDTSVRYQFERLGYFWRDPLDGMGERLVFNRIVQLKDTWARRSAAARSSAGAHATPADRTPAAVPSGLGRGDAAGVEPDPAAALTEAQRSTFERILGLGVPRDDAAQIAGREDLSHLFTGALAEHDAPRSIANWLVNEVARALKDRPPNDLGVTPERLAALARLVDDGTVTARVAKELLEEVLERGTDPELLVRERGLERLDDPPAIRAIAARVAAEHPAEVAAFRGGKTGLKGFFIGQVMRATQGRADPKLVQRLVEEVLTAT